MRQRLATDAIQGRQCVAAGGRVGRVGRQQQRRPFAADQAARKIGRDHQHELHVAAFQQTVAFRFAGGASRDAKIGGILQAGDQAARELALVALYHGQRQMLGVGVDREAEQDQLQDRHPDHHRESQAVALDLAKFLDQDRDEAAPVDRVSHSCPRHCASAR